MRLVDDYDFRDHLLAVLKTTIVLSCGVLICYNA